jgi:D-alanine-D-alanine ligase-like ATP-grasp enzyme
VNTIPGMSAASIIPKQIHAMGTTTIKDLYTNLIIEAIERMREGLKKE